MRRTDFGTVGRRKKRDVQKGKMQWRPREVMYTDQPYEHTAPYEMAPMMPRVPMQRHPVMYMPPQYYAPPIPYWEYEQRHRGERHHEYAGARSGLSGHALADASSGFQQLEEAVKTSVKHAKLHGLRRHVNIHPKNTGGVTRTEREWDAIEMRVTDDEGVDQEYSKLLMQDVLRIVDAVKSRLQSNLLPTHVAAAVGAIDLLRHLLKYYQDIVAGTVDAEPRYHNEDLKDLDRLLKANKHNMKDVAELTSKAARNDKFKEEHIEEINEALRSLLRVYKENSTNQKFMSKGTKKNVDEMVANVFP
jgi:hypothetical protein